MSEENNEYQNQGSVFIDPKLLNPRLVAEKESKNQPIMVVKLDINGTKKEVALYLRKSRDSGELVLTQFGTNILGGTIDIPYSERVQATSGQPTPSFPNNDPESIDDNW